MRFRILGAIDASVDGHPVPLAATKVRALLAVLACRRDQPIGRDWLVDAMWPVDPPHSARQTLAHYVWRLRRLPTVDAYAADLEQRFPDRVAGIWFEHQPVYRLVVRLTTGTLDAMAVPSAIGVTPVQVRADAARSLRTVRAELDRLRPRINRDLPGVGSGLDVRTGEIVLHTYGAGAATAQRNVDGVRLATSVPVRVRAHTRAR